MKKQTFTEYYDMMDKKAINEAPMAGFSFGGPTIDKGVQKGAEAVGKGIKKKMRQIDLKTMKNWKEVPHEDYSKIQSELSSDAHGKKILVKDEYSVAIQGVKDAFINYFPEIQKAINKKFGVNTYSKSTNQQDADSKNRVQKDQAGSPTVVDAYITQSPNRFIKATQGKIPLGGSMGGKIVFVTTVDSEEVEHYYIGCDEVAYASIKGIARISFETALNNKSFGKVLSSGRDGKGGGWTMWTSVEMNPEEYKKSMKILSTDLQTKFKPPGFESEKLTAKNYPEDQGPYVGGDYGWVLASSGPQFPNAQIAVFGKTNTDDSGKSTYTINVYGKSQFSTQKYINQVYEMIQAKVDATKVGKPQNNAPYARASGDAPADTGDDATDTTSNAKTGHTIDVALSSALVDADYQTIKDAQTMDGIQKILPELHSRDLATVFSGISKITGNKVDVKINDVDERIVIKKNNKLIMAFGGTPSGGAKIVLTQYGYDLLTQGINSNNPDIKNLKFKEGTI